MSENSYEKAIEAFGKLVITKMRDPAIRKWSGVLKRRANESIIGESFRPVLKSLSEEQIEALVPLVSKIVDDTLFNMLWAFEEERWANISVEADNIRIGDLREAIGGDLQGYIWAWADMYSDIQASNR